MPRRSAVPAPRTGAPAFAAHAALAVIAAIAALAAVAPAQGAGGSRGERDERDALGMRKPAIVRVHGADGKPGAGAVVTFVGRALHVPASLLPADVVTATADARGHAVGALLPGLCYAAWAVAAGDGPARAVSTAQGWFGAGALLELRCDVPVEAPAIAPRVPAGYGALRWFVHLPAFGCRFALEPGADGALARPAVPPALSTLLDADAPDGTVWSLAYALDGSRMVRGGELDVPQMQAIPMRVLDAAGNGVAGVAIRQRFVRRATFTGSQGAPDETWRTVAVTDADGTAKAIVPTHVDPLATRVGSDLMFTVVKEGFVQSVSGFRGQDVYLDDRKWAGERPKELRFTLRPSTPLRGRVLGDERTPASGLRVALLATAKLAVSNSGYSHDPRVFTTTVGDDGSFAFDGVPDELHAQRLVLLPPAGASPDAVWRLPVFPFVRGRKDRDPIALGAQATVRLRVRDPRGGPAAGGVAHFVPAAGAVHQAADGLFRIALGPAGAADVVLPPGEWCVAALGADGWCAEKLTLVAGDQTADLALQPPQRARLEILDRDGAPMAGARAIVTATGGTGRELLAEALRLAGVPPGWNAAASDAEGRLEVTWVPVPGARPMVSVQGGGTRSTAVPLVDIDHPIPIRMR